MLLLSKEMLQKYLSEICSCQALEVHTDKDKVYIPYMMNDALECFLLFCDAQLIGHPLSDYEGDISYEIIRKTAESEQKIFEDNRAENTESSGKTGLIFRQGTQNVFTLWYTSVYQDLHCYRYDRIGHFWVTGQEHWRRLVYILGTIYDKYEYLGAKVCNPQEIALLKLMEFAPLYYYSPIHDPLDTIYPDTLEGLQAMKALAKKAGDRRYMLLLDLYRYFPFAGVRKILQKALNRPARIPLYELLFHKIEQASCTYSERDYGEEHNLQIADARKQLSDQLLQQGFLGEYPFFQKENLQILAMEEHPFTILEADTFKFRIQLMESETSKSDSGLNAGFFEHKNNRCRIVTPKMFN